MVGCDYTVTTTDVVIAPGLEKEVLSHWARQTRPDWDALIVAPLPGYQLHGLEIADAFQEVFPYSDVIYKKDYSPHIVFDLPPTFNQYLDGLSKREKANILQDDRRMRREYKVCVYARTTPENVEAAFDRFLPLHQELWQDKDRLGHFGDWPECEAFHRVLVNRLALKERLVIIELEADGRVVASQYAFTFGQRVHWFLAGRTNAAEYRKVSLGRMGLMNLVEYSIERGFNQIDGLRGYYEYKLRQGGRLTCLQSVHVIQGGLRPKLAMMLFRSGSWFLDLAYYRLWFRRISTKLGTTQPLWKTWIKSRL